MYCNNCKCTAQALGGGLDQDRGCLCQESGQARQQNGQGAGRNGVCQSLLSMYSTTHLTFVNTPNVLLHCLLHRSCRGQVPCTMAFRCCFVIGTHAFLAHPCLRTSPNPALSFASTCCCNNMVLLPFNPWPLQLQVDTNIQSDDLRHRVQQLELRLCGTTLDPVLSTGSAEMGVSGRRSALGHNRPQLGLAVLDRLDQLDRDFEGVSRVANKAKVRF